MSRCQRRRRNQSTGAAELDPQRRPSDRRCPAAGFHGIFRLLDPHPRRPRSVPTLAGPRARSAGRRRAFGLRRVVGGGVAGPVTARRRAAAGGGSVGLPSGRAAPAGDGDTGVARVAWRRQRRRPSPTSAAERSVGDGAPIGVRPEPALRPTQPCSRGASLCDTAAIVWCLIQLSHRLYWPHGQNRLCAPPPVCRLSKIGRVFRKR